MSSKSTTAFFNNLQGVQQELTNRVKELKDAAMRENPHVSKRSSRLGWLDELETLEETLNTQTELSRSAMRLHALVALAETSTAALETALTRAENLAVIRYGYEVPAIPATPRVASAKTMAASPAPRSVRKKPATPRLSHGQAQAYHPRSSVRQTPLADTTNQSESTPVMSVKKSAFKKADSLITPVGSKRNASVASGAARRRYAAPSPALSDPPTPNMADLGLSVAGLSLLRRG